MEGSAVRPGSMPLLVDTEEVPHRNCQRLVLLGSAKVGKTSIVSRFLHDTFDDNYTPTIEDFHRKIYKIRGESYRLDLLDTSGNHPFPAMRRLSLLTGKMYPGKMAPVRWSQINILYDVLSSIQTCVVFYNFSIKKPKAVFSPLRISLDRAAGQIGCPQPTARIPLVSVAGQRADRSRLLTDNRDEA
ncbi:hypothetical protein LSH36_421g00012 [Paralvinella palmiformis]|uniref:Dexamethasone-induced Ras-related protein 1 n=1 Tax=Paralvinella palmiformis TaxID=53620 RepID=A0AAD9JBH4_9ANNE|nr:hypothetical protein LSH36_421g00012 [Paralvinella palmiformis]